VVSQKSIECRARSAVPADLARRIPQAGRVSIVRRAQQQRGRVDRPAGDDDAGRVLLDCPVPLDDDPVHRAPGRVGLRSRDQLVIADDTVTRTAPLSTVAAAGAFVGVTPGLPASAYRPPLRSGQTLRCTSTQTAPARWPAGISSPATRSAAWPPT
jgi:hypothetical protein